MNLHVKVAPPFRYNVARAKCDCCDDVTVFMDIQPANTEASIRLMIPEADAETMIAKVASALLSPPIDMEGGEFDMDPEWVYVGEVDDEGVG